MSRSKNKGALDHYLRDTICNHILEYPGVSFSKLKKVYNVNDSTLRYHLQYLEREQRISQNMENGKLHYYPFNGIASTVPISNRHKHQNSLTVHQETILRTIDKYPRITQKELGERTKLKRFILTYNISKLIDMGFIRKLNHQRNVCYESITQEQLQIEMLKVLTIKFLNDEIDEETYYKLKGRLENDSY